MSYVIKITNNKTGAETYFSYDDVLTTPTPPDLASAYLDKNLKMKKLRQVEKADADVFPDKAAVKLFVSALQKKAQFSTISYVDLDEEDKEDVGTPAGGPMSYTPPTNQPDSSPLPSDIPTMDLKSELVLGGAIRKDPKCKCDFDAIENNLNNLKNTNKSLTSENIRLEAELNALKCKTERKRNCKEFWAKVRSRISSYKPQITVRDTSMPKDKHMRARVQEHLIAQLPIIVSEEHAEIIACLKPSPQSTLTRHDINQAINKSLALVDFLKGERDKLDLPKRAQVTAEPEEFENDVLADPNSPFIDND